LISSKIQILCAQVTASSVLVMAASFPPALSLAKWPQTGADDYVYDWQLITND
jgi:hypothetical protein